MDNALTCLDEAETRELGIEDTTAQGIEGIGKSLQAAAAGQIEGWAWANKPSTTINQAYKPAKIYRYNSQGGTNKVVRLGTSHYRVIFPKLVTSGGNVTGLGLWRQP